MNCSVKQLALGIASPEGCAGRELQNAEWLRAPFPLTANVPFILATLHRPVATFARSHVIKYTQNMYIDAYP